MFKRVKKYLVIAGLFSTFVFSNACYAAGVDVESSIPDGGKMDGVLQSGSLLMEEKSSAGNAKRDGINAGKAGISEADREKLYVRLADAFTNFEREFDISEYDVDQDTFDSVKADVLNDNPGFFYVYFCMGYSSTYGGKVSTVYVTYDGSEEECRREMAEFEKAIKDFRSGVRKEWSEMEKMVYINDFLARYCEYETRYSGNPPTGQRIYTAYGALVDRIAVCQGYALAVNMLADLVGIESHLVASNTLNHAWNVVKINGKYYMVDVTWNDPVEDKLGRAGHQYLMKSYGWFNSTKGKHVATDYVFNDGIKAADVNDRYYDSYMWDDSYAGFDYIDGKWYGYDPSELAIRSCTCDGKVWSWDETVVNVSSETWLDWEGEGYWPQFYCFSTAACGNKLYYIYPDSIHQYDVKTGESALVYQRSTSESSEGFIYGIYVESDKTLKYLISKSPIIEAKDNRIIRSFEVEDTDTDETSPKLSLSNKDKTWEDTTGEEDNYFTNSESFLVDASDDYLESTGFYFSKCKVTDSMLIWMKEGSWRKPEDGSFKIKSGSKGYVYARAVDTSGNTSYAGTGYVIIDTDKPVISTPDNKLEFYKTVDVTVTDDYLDKVYLNDEEAELTDGKLTVSESENIQTVKAVDKAGNETTCEIKVSPEKKEEDPKEDDQSEDKKDDKKDDGKPADDKKADDKTEVKVGDSVKDEKTKATYKVTASGDAAAKSTVTYVAPANKNLSSVTVPDTVTINGKQYMVTEIAANAFKGSKKLTSVVIGKNVKKIGKNAFFKCNKLKNIKIKTTKLKLKTVGSAAFKGIHKKAKFRLPKSKLKAYKKVLLKRGGTKKMKYVKL